VCFKDRFLSLLIPGALAVSISTTAVAAATPDEMARKDEWLRQNLLSRQAGLPFSFTYDGQSSAALLPSWERKVTEKKLDKNRTEHVLTWNHPESGLEVRCRAVEYPDFPVVEWTVSLRNAGKKNTPLIEAIQGLDTTFQRTDKGEFVLRGIKGDSCTPDSYRPYEITIEPGAEHRFVPVGGRPTNGNFPYYNLHMPGGGIILAVGWPGQWATSFVRDKDKGLHITAGQELTRMYLKPGEEIRTPLIALMFYDGDDVVRSQNIWRRWMLAHNLPGPDGKPVKPIYAVGGDDKTIDLMVREKVKIDYLWVDAGSLWYPCGGDWWNTGTWEVDRSRYPKGIKAISDHAHANGIKLILWFEPERARQSTWLYDKHPEMLVSNGDYSKYVMTEKNLLINRRDALLNLADEDVCNWLIDRMDTIIKEEGVDFYRSDFNTDPIGWWRGADTPDRQGIIENLYVQGYLRYWDELLRRNPGMRIDTCASGGRRNDLETLRRAVPLLRSDYQSFDANLGYDTGNQGHTYGLSFWFPFYGTGVGYTQHQHSVYGVRSYMCPSLVIGSRDFGKPDFDWDSYRRLVAQWRRVADCMLGDYYPLTEYSLAEEKWIAWQFDRPEQGDGAVQAFRRTRSEETSNLLRLHGLDPHAEYEITNLDTGTSNKTTGKELMGRGLTVTIQTKPGSAIILYQKSE